MAGLGGAIQLPKGGADLLMDFNILAAIFVVVVIGSMGSMLGGVHRSGSDFSSECLWRCLPTCKYFGADVCRHSCRPDDPSLPLAGREEVAGEHGQVGEPEPPIKPDGSRTRLAVAALLAVLALEPVID